ISRVVRRAMVPLSLLIHSLGDCRATKTLHRAHSAEGVVKDIAPVAKHVQDDAAVVFLAIVPRGSLCRLPVSLENPVAELAAYGKNPSEKAAIHKAFQLPHTRQKE